MSVGAIYSHSHEYTCIAGMLLLHCKLLEKLLFATIFFGIIELKLEVYLCIPVISFDRLRHIGLAGKKNSRES